MREIRYYINIIRKRDIDTDDWMAIASAICCVISISFGCIFLIVNMVSFADCMQTKEDTDRCYTGTFYAAIVLTLLNILIWCSVTHCCFDCFWQGCCYRWRKRECRKVLQILKNHDMVKELDVEHPNDVVQHLEQMVQQTWIYKDNYRGNDARSLQLINHKNIRIRYVFQLNNPEHMERYFLRHLDTYPTYSLPLQLKHTPIRTNRVERQKVMSEVSLKLETVARTVSRTNLKTLPKSKSVTAMQTNACSSDPNLIRKSTSFTGISVHHMKVKTEMDYSHNKEALPGKVMEHTVRPNSVAPGASLRSVFRRSSTTTKMPIAPPRKDEIHIDMDGIGDGEIQSSPEKDVVFCFSSDEEDEDVISDDSAFNHDTVFNNPGNIPNGGLENITESYSQSSSNTDTTLSYSVEVEKDTNENEEQEEEAVSDNISCDETKHTDASRVNLEPLTINSSITNTGEAYLFHGTKLENIVSIIENGFILDHSKAGFYGKGIYLAESSQKADQYADEPTNRRTTFLPMFVVRTSLGRMSMYNPSAKLDESTSTTESNVSGHNWVEGEHTIVAGTKKRFREFIKQDASQCYPEFLIIYDRVK